MYRSRNHRRPPTPLPRPRRRRPASPWPRQSYPLPSAAEVRAPGAGAWSCRGTRRWPSSRHLWTRTQTCQPYLPLILLFDGPESINLLLEERLDPVEANFGVDVGRGIRETLHRAVAPSQVADVTAFMRLLDEGLFLAILLLEVTPLECKLENQVLGLGLVDLGADVGGDTADNMGK